MRELNKNAWVFEMTVDESCKNIDDIPAKLDDGSVFYIIEMPFEPILNYDEYY